MKTRSPLTKMSKPLQRRQLSHDVQQYLQAGGQIRQLTGTTTKARQVNLNNLIAQMGFYHEL